MIRLGRPDGSGQPCQYDNGGGWMDEARSDNQLELGAHLLGYEDGDGRSAMRSIDSVISLDGRGEGCAPHPTSDHLGALLTHLRTQLLADTDGDGGEDDQQ